MLLGKRVQYSLRGSNYIMAISTEQKLLSFLSRFPADTVFSISTILEGCFGIPIERQTLPMKRRLNQILRRQLNYKHLGGNQFQYKGDPNE